MDDRESDPNLMAQSELTPATPQSVPPKLNPFNEFCHCVEYQASSFITEQKSC